MLFKNLTFRKKFKTDKVVGNFTQWIKYIIYYIFNTKLIFQ